MPEPHDRPRRRGLAGAVAAEQHGQAAARHHEVDALQDVILADQRVHALKLKQRLAHISAPALPDAGAAPRYASCTIGEAITASGSPSATRPPLCNTTMRSARLRTTS